MGQWFPSLTLSMLPAQNPQPPSYPEKINNFINPFFVKQTLRLKLTDGNLLQSVLFWKDLCHAAAIAEGLFNNYSSSPNGPETIAHEDEDQMNYRLWGREGERNNCFSKIQLHGKKYRDKTTLASKTWFSRHCFGFQSRRFSLPVGYNT